MKKLMFLLVFCALGISGAWAQKTFSGKVIGPDGLGLPGVSVVEKANTVNGVATDIDGNWTLTVPDGNSVLLFTAIGMKTVEVAAKDASELKMKADAQLIDEVVITGYGNKAKTAFTGSASSVKAEALRESSSISSVKALQGKASGVIVSQTSGQPGAGASVRIRGVGSINGNQSPLYVIDGIPVKTGDFTVGQTSASVLNNLNPEDIESQTILKDAAATALYGSRGANGVILITTKSGKSGKTKINLNLEYGVSDFANDDVIDYMDGAEYAEYAVEGLKNYYLYQIKQALPGQANESQYESLQEEATNWAYMTLPQLGLYHPDDKFDGKFDYANMTLEQAKQYVTNGRNVNWKDEIFRKGKAEKYDLSFSGGTEKLRYYSSLGYNKVEGIAEGTSFKRLSGALSIEADATDYLKIRFRENLSHVKQEGATTGKWYYANPMFAYFSINPTAPIYNVDGTYNNTPGFSNKLPSPILNRQLNSKTNKMLRSLTNLFAEVTFTDFLKFNSTNGIDFIYSNDRNVIHPESNDGIGTDGSLERYKTDALELTSKNLLMFDKTFNLHHVNGLAGFEYKTYNFNQIGATVETFASADLMYLSNGSVRKSAAETELDDVLVSYVGKADYDYDGKYFASASWRRDGSSRLASDKRWGDFYAGSLAWVLSKESFLDTVDWLDFLKLKVSYGTTGNLPTALYGAQALYGVSGKYLGSPTISLSQAENNSLTWEKSYTWNAGLDFTILEKIKGSVEFYQKDTKGLLNDTSLLWATGYSTYTQNKGHLRNRGFDIEISSTNIENNDFTWTTDFNISHYKAKIIELDEPIDDFPYYYGEGDELYTYRLREWAGIDSATGMPQWVKNTKNADGTRDKSLTTNPLEAEKVKVGVGSPDFTGGITNNFTYKGFELSFLMIYRLGGQLYDPMSYYKTDGSAISSGLNIYSGTLDKHWKKPGDKAEYGRLIYNAPEHGNYNSNRRLVDGDFLKLKNLTFGYTLPSSITKRLKLEKVKFYVNATDLFTLFSDSTIDPEVSQSGLVTNPSVYFPQLRTYRFGINVQF